MSSYSWSYVWSSCYRTRGFGVGFATVSDFTTYCGETVKQEVANPTSANSSKACCCHSVCATCQQHWTWFAKLYWLEINVVFRSDLGNPSSLACIFYWFPDTPTAEKTKCHKLNIEWFLTYQSHQVSSLSASPCPSPYTHSCQINKIN